MPRKKKEDSGTARPSIPVKVAFKKDIPDAIRAKRNRKYRPVLEQLKERPGTPALLGTYSAATAGSLITSLRSTAKAADLGEFKFSQRAIQEVDADGQPMVSVYAQFNG